jgi:hypothetical protein
MRVTKALFSLIPVLLVFLIACGGSGSNNSNSISSHVLQPGTTVTLGVNVSVLVPAGATITTPMGSVITISGADNVVNVPVGSVVKVPLSATGVANTTVTTAAATGLAATVTVLAGSTTCGNPADGSGSGAVFWCAGGTYLKLDPAGNIVLSDQGKLRKVTQAGIASTYTNSGLTLGEVNSGIAVDGTGNIFAVGINSQPVQYSVFLQEVTAGGAVEMLSSSFEIGGWNLGVGGLDVDSSGNLYFADSQNNRVMKITQAGVATIFAGTGAAGMNDGDAGTATFNGPNDLAFDGNGNLFVADSLNRAVRKITPDGTVSTFLGGMGADYLAIDKSGNLYVAADMELLYRVSPSAVVTEITPSVVAPFSGLALDGQGNIYTRFWGTTAEVVKITPQ